MAGPAFTMRMETARFNRHIQKMINKYPGKANIILKKFGLDVLKRIIQKNPVRTGRSRAGWYAAMQGLGGQYNFGSSLEVEEGKGQGSYKEHLFGSKRWIDLINAVKYAIFLEYGHSLQAPHGMVRISMREMTGDKLPSQLGDEMQKEWLKFYI